MSDSVEHHSRGLARDASLGIVGRVFAMVCSSITALVVASTLIKSDYGAYAIVFGIQVVLVMALDLGLTSALARYVAQGRADTKLIVQVALLRLLVICVAALLILGSTLVAAVDDAPIGPLLPALAALVIAQSLVAFHFGSLPSMRRIRLLLLVTIAQPIVELLLVLRARAGGGGAEEMILATVYAGVGVSVLAWVLLLAPGRAASRDIVQAPPNEHATLGMVARYGREIFVVSLLIAVIGQVDQFVIGAFRSLVEVAPFALAIKVQALVAAPAITIAGIVAPRVAGAGAAAQAMYRQWLAFLIVLTSGGVLVIAVLASELFGAIDMRYRDDAELLWALAPFLLLSAVAPLPSILLNQTGHAASRLRIAAITIAVNLGLDVALVPWLGAYGAAIGTGVAFGYYFLHHDILVERALGEGATSPAPTIRWVLLRGAAAALVAAGIAAAVRVLLEATIEDPTDLVVLLVAGGAAAIVHTAWSVRIIRRPLA